jgi:ADP-heptose:LPS heptosyltransferase
MVPRRILVVRNDKLGDFMLAWPSFRLLKEHLPDAEIVALVPDYTRPMAQVCPWIDRVIVDPGQGTRAFLTLVGKLRRERFDAVLTLFSTTRVGLACRLAGIPYRLAPATKLAQVFYNRRLLQKRSRSEKPEFRYNLDLAVRLLADHGIHVHDEPRPPYLRFPESEVQTIRDGLFTSFGLPSQTAGLIFVHPGSGGSAGNLTLDQYARLCRGLQSAKAQAIIITAGPGEEAAARKLAGKLGDLPHSVLPPTSGLVDFARHLQAADLFISGSTGPLHIAGALNRRTAAFYPGHRSATPLRWQTLNDEDKRLAFSPPEEGDITDVSRIDIDSAAAQISERFLK